MSDQPDPRRGFKLLVIPDDGSETRSIHVGPTLARIARPALVVFVVLLVFLLGSWWYLAVRAARVDDLEARVAQLQEREGRVRSLSASLEEAEARYERLREMFGSDTTSAASGVWLPALDAGGSTSDRSENSGEAPSSWPLTERGFITQPLLMGDDGEHQGLDIAIPSHSYIRAAGDGEVLEVGEDSIYGRFVVLEHGGGYRSVYGHASETLVEVGQEVRVDEVIALSGSTGRSTAPHLHFEILLEGEPVDPLTLVQQP